MKWIRRPVEEMKMYILTSDGKSIVDTSFVERFCLVEKPAPI